MGSTNSKKITEPITVTTIEAIPTDIMTEVLAQVAANSVTDISNVKLSCKSFSELAEDRIIYQNVSLDKFSPAPWWPLDEKQQLFLTKCRECHNPELLCREAVVDYFNKKSCTSAHINLQKAVDLGHLGALYVKCIIFLLDDDSRLKDEGIKVLGRMTKSDYWMTKLRLCRFNLIEMLKIMWVNHPRVRRRPICCNENDNHKAKIGWDGEMENNTCEACNADNELKFICKYLPTS